jgi:hypothetical protein
VVVKLAISLPAEGSDPTIRLMAYGRLIRRLQNEINSEPNLAPLIVAYIRGLRMFPEHRDTTVMFLDTISVHGQTPFDHLVRQEVTTLLDELLGYKND